MSLPVQIRTLADQGLSPDEIADSLGCERAYVRISLGLGISDEDEQKALDVIRGVAFSPFTKDSDKLNAAKWIYEQRNVAARRGAHASVHVGAGGSVNIAVVIEQAFDRFAEQAKRMMNESITIGSGGTETPCLSGGSTESSGEPVHGQAAEPATIQAADPA